MKTVKREKTLRKEALRREALKNLTFVKGKESEKELVPITLSGFADLVGGSIEVVNKGEEPVRLKTIPVSGINLRLQDGSVFNEIKVFKKLKPGVGAKVPISIDLDPCTPPGNYKGKLTIGEEKRNFIINVAEQLRIDVSPRKFVIINQPGAQIEKTVFITNIGNVKVTLGKIGRVVLEEAFPFCGPIRAALELGAKDGYQTVLDIFAKRMNEALNKVGSLNVNIKSKEVEILPGETKPVDLVISIPKSLPATKRYHAAIPILNKNIIIIIQPI